ncbi:MAG: RNA-binding domain-containing protein [Candidatus Thorarchaeota archaeon SMTZ1-83]
MASTIIHPTEDAERVGAALGNLFLPTSLPAETEGHQIRITSTNRDSLDYVRSKIHSVRIIDAVRSRLLSNWDGEETTLCFDKQAAYHGKLRLVDDRQEEPPLGPLELTLGFASEEEFEAFLAWFAPPTKDGRVINR